MIWLIYLIEASVAPPKKKYHGLFAEDVGPNPTEPAPISNHNININMYEITVR